MATIQVPPEILDQTDRCSMDFACLDKGKCICETYDWSSDDTVFVRGLAAWECLYAIRYGEAHICRCPTHYHICTHGLE